MNKININVTDTDECINNELSNCHDLMDTETKEMIGHWFKYLLERVNKTNTTELTVEEIDEEIDAVKGTIDNERILIGISEFAEQNIKHHEVYIKVLEGLRE